MMMIYFQILKIKIKKMIFPKIRKSLKSKREKKIGFIKIWSNIKVTFWYRVKSKRRRKNLNKLYKAARLMKSKIFGVISNLLEKNKLILKSLQTRYLNISLLNKIIPMFIMAIFWKKCMARTGNRKSVTRRFQMNTKCIPLPNFFRMKIQVKDIWCSIKSNIFSMKNTPIKMPALFLLLSYSLIRNKNSFSLNLNFYLMHTININWTNRVCITLY